VELADPQELLERLREAERDGGLNGNAPGLRLTKLREVRKRMGVTAKELAEVMGMGGSTLRGWENGSSGPRSLEVAEDAAACLGHNLLDITDPESLEGYAGRAGAFVVRKREPTRRPAEGKAPRGAVPEEGRPAGEPDAPPAADDALAELSLRVAAIEERLGRPSIWGRLLPSKTRG